MARASNQKEQMMKKFKRSIARLTSYTVTDDVTAAGDPGLIIKSGANTLCYAAITRQTFSGFNVVAELSSSAAEGLPEHRFQVAFDTTQTAPTVFASVITSVAGKLGTSVLEVYTVAGAVSSASLVVGNLQATIANDPESGSVGA